MRLIRKDVKVEWTDLGEGLCGDYDPDDPKDVHLLRFDIYHKEHGRWIPVDDASYCTQVPVATPTLEKKRLLGVIMDEVYDSVHDGNSIKKLCERLSWIAPDPSTLRHRPSSAD